MDWANGIKQPPTHKTADEDERLKLPMKIFLMTTVVFLKASPLECSLIQKIWKNNCIESTFLEENELVTAKLFRWLNADILSQLMKSEFCLLYRQKWKRWPKAITTISIVMIIRSKLHLLLFLSLGSMIN